MSIEILCVHGALSINALNALQCDLLINVGQLAPFF